MSDSKISPKFLKLNNRPTFENDCEQSEVNFESQQQRLLIPVNSDNGITHSNVNGRSKDSHTVSNIRETPEIPANTQGCAGKAGTKIQGVFGDWCKPSHWKFQVVIGIIICIEIAVIVVLYHNKQSAESSEVDQYDQQLSFDTEEIQPDQSTGIKKKPVPFYNNPSYGEMKHNEKVIVDSPFKLHSITQATHTVTVTKLIAEGYAPTGISKAGRESVRHLELSGQINLAWLHYLLKSFPNLSTLSTNVDEIGDSIKKDKVATIKSKKLAPVALTNLEEIVVNSAQKYGIFDFGFDITLASVKTVSISYANLDSEKFKIFFRLLSQTAQSIEEITIADSAICSTCDVTELQFENLRHLNITRRREEGELAFPNREHLSNLKKASNVHESMSSEEYESKSVEHYDYEWRKR